MSNEWNEIGEDEVTRALRQGLQAEADRTPVPDRYDEIVAAAEQGRRRRGWLLVAAVMVPVLGAVGYLGGRLTSGGLAGTPAQVPATVTAATEASESSVPTLTPEPSASAPATAATSRASSKQSASAPTSPRLSPPAEVSGSALAFVSPSGAIECVMGGTRAPDGVECHLTVKAVWGPKHRCESVNGTVPWSSDYGVVFIGSEGATTYCNGQGFTELDLSGSDGKRYTSWYDPSRFETRTAANGSLAPVLPYGTTAVVGQTRCQISQSGGISCSRGDQTGFRLSTQTLVLRNGGKDTSYTG